MKHNILPDELHDNSTYVLIKVVPYSEMKSFILNQIKQKDRLIKAYGILQIIAAAGILFLLVYYGISALKQMSFTLELKGLLVGILFSFSLLIFIHEGIHALTFIALGKRNISFGAQWKKFLFYAESNLQVLNRPQMIVVALAPLVSISILCLIGIIITGFNAFSLSLCEVLLIHIFFCSGDITIVSFFNKHSENELFTYDDREKQKTFYFKRRNSFRSESQNTEEKNI